EKQPPPDRARRASRPSRTGWQACWHVPDDAGSPAAPGDRQNLPSQPPSPHNLEPDLSRRSRIEGGRCRRERHPALARRLILPWLPPAATGRLGPILDAQETRCEPERRGLVSRLLLS